jgi:hypothetical protein
MYNEVQKMTELGYMPWCTQMNICFLHISKFRHILPTCTIKHPNIKSQDFQTSQILSWFYTLVLVVATITYCWLSTILKHCDLEHAFLQHIQIHISLYHQINFEQIWENVQTLCLQFTKTNARWVTITTHKTCDLLQLPTVSNPIHYYKFLDQTP